MKVLIADDELIARKVLASFLEKTGHQVVTASDGQEAINVLLGPDAPPIAVLDIMMPVLSGREVCARIRRDLLTLKPYVILLSARADKAEIAAGLDAGADDYLVKPFHPVELLARLRVAQRSIEYQRAMLKTISELRCESVTAAGEATEQSDASAAPRLHVLPRPTEEVSAAVVSGVTAPATGAAAAGSPAPKPIPSPASLEASTVASAAERKRDRPRMPIPDEELNEIIVRALARLRFGSAISVPPDAPVEPVGVSYCAWNSIALASEGIWLDLVLEVEAKAAATLFEKALRRRPDSDRELAAEFAEFMAVVVESIQASLAAKGTEGIVPFRAQAGRADGVGTRPPLPLRREILRYSLHDVQLAISVLPVSNPVRQKSAGQLRTGDILAEPFRSPNIQDVLLLNKGVVLNEVFIEKLSTLVQTEVEMKGLHLPVLQPTSLAQFFCGRDFGRALVA